MTHSAMRHDMLVSVWILMPMYKGNGRSVFKVCQELAELKLVYLLKLNKMALETLRIACKTWSFRPTPLSSIRRYECLKSLWH